jgi:nitrogen fixation/metabolism regulation signal transduction histidine kinase
MMTWFLIKLANAITRPVIELYELIKHIVDQGKGAKTKLSFKNTNRELNNLHRTFNQIVKTMQVAKSAAHNEDPSQALLNYYEAVDVFSKFNNHKAMGMCYNNIGCLHFG